MRWHDRTGENGFVFGAWCWTSLCPPDDRCLRVFLYFLLPTYREKSHSPRTNPLPRLPRYVQPPLLRGRPSIKHVFITVVIIVVVVIITTSHKHTIRSTIRSNRPTARPTPPKTDRHACLRACCNVLCLGVRLSGASLMLLADAAVPGNTRG